MRHLKQLCAACTLALVLAISAFGGQMTTGIAAPPPSPDQPSATTQGQMTTGYSATDPTTEVLLSLLQSLLSLF